MKVNGKYMVKLMKPLKDLFMHELLSTGSPEPPTPPVPLANVVTGSFKGTVTGSKISAELQIPSGSYIKALFVFPTDGVTPDSLIYTDSTNYAIVEYAVYKEYINLAPSFANQNQDKATLMYLYKRGSGTFSDSYERGKFTYTRLESAGSLTECVSIRDNNKIEFYIGTSRYAGFLKNVDYTYLAYY